MLAHIRHIQKERPTLDYDIDGVAYKVEDQYENLVEDLSPRISDAPSTDGLSQPEIDMLNKMAGISPVEIHDLLKPDVPDTEYVMYGDQHSHLH